MIRVNLLPVKRKKKAKAVPAFIISMVLLTLVAVVVAGFLFWNLNSQIASYKKQKMDNEAKITELKNKIKEVENFEAQKKTLEERTKIIEQLRKNQSVPVKVLTEMSKVLPSGVWLNSMTVAGTNISVAGVGFTNEDVVNYVENLKKSQFFGDVYLMGSTRAGTGKVITYSFTLTCKIKGL